MARAHVIYDYPLHHSTPARTTPRDVWYRSTEEEPIVVPKNGVFRAGGGLILAALTGIALVAGSAYAVINAPAPPMAETPTSPLLRGYTPDTQFVQANVTNELSGPAMAVPQTGVTTQAADREPIFHVDTSRDSRDSETFIDDSAPGVQPQQPPPPAAQTAPVPEPTPPQTPAEPLSPTYPNPTTTPPDGYAPSQKPLEGPPIERQNPYF